MTRCSVSIFLFSIIATLGCRRGTTAQEDPNADVVAELTNFRAPDSAADQRRQLALSKWQNGVVDREPILLVAILTRAVGAHVLDVVVFAYDEDKDLLGLGVVERYKDGTQRSEEYPIYVHADSTRIVRPGSIPVYLRDKGQQKDESRWEEYIRGDRIDKWSMGHTGGTYYRDTLPPVYISLPDPNKVDVLVYLYDRRGNKSPPVELTNRLNVNDPENDKAHPVGIRRVRGRGITGHGGE
jgi:hypothetical protein